MGAMGECIKHGGIVSLRETDAGWLCDRCGGEQAALWRELQGCNPNGVVTTHINGVQCTIRRTDKDVEMEAKAAKWDAHEKANTIKIQTAHGQIEVKPDPTLPKDGALWGIKATGTLKNGVTLDPMPSLRSPYALFLQEREKAAHLREVCASELLAAGVITKPEEYIGALKYQPVPPLTQMQKAFEQYHEEVAQHLLKASGINSVVRGTAESGPGLAAKHKDVTQPETMRSGPITVDLSGDWD